jgi:N-terminal acetyltransferase B complex non-catalytic subunit
MMVLRQQGKDEAALELLTGELAGLWKDDSEKDRMERELLWTLKRWPDVNRIAKTALQKDVDDWSLYQLYFDSVFGLLGKQSSSSITNGDDVTEQSGDQEADLDVLAAWKFVDSLADKERSKTRAKLRGPFLALMELASRSRESGVGAHLDNEASPLDMLHSFFEMFADRSCCYNDLKPYLSMLDDTQRSEFLDKLNKQKPLSSSSEENQSVDIQQSVKTMQRHICSIQLARSMGVHVRLNTEEKRTVAGELMQHFRNGIHYG